MTSGCREGDSGRDRLRRMVGMGLLSLTLLGVGCTVLIPKETQYLRSAKNKATQEEVRQQLGEPKLVAATKTGEAIWVYHVYLQDPGPANKWGAAGTWCDEYVLTFDKQGILRDWTHKSEGHGGELMPTYCVENGFKPPT